jgi:hypothetical protein
MADKITASDAARTGEDADKGHTALSPAQAEAYRATDIKPPVNDASFAGSLEMPGDFTKSTFLEISNTNLPGSGLETPGDFRNSRSIKLEFFNPLCGGSGEKGAEYSATEVDGAIAKLYRSSGLANPYHVGAAIRSHPEFVAAMENAPVNDASFAGSGLEKPGDFTKSTFLDFSKTDGFALDKSVKDELLHPVKVESLNPLRGGSGEKGAEYSATEIDGAIAKLYRGSGLANPHHVGAAFRSRPEFVAAMENAGTGALKDFLKLTDMHNASLFSKSEEIGYSFLRSGHGKLGMAAAAAAGLVVAGELLFARHKSEPTAPIHNFEPPSSSLSNFQKWPETYPALYGDGEQMTKALRNLKSTDLERSENK